MSREFPDVQRSDFIDEGLLKLLQRDLAALTTFSGEGAPENGPEGVFYNDLLNRVIATKDEKIIDYKVGTPNSGSLERSYQPLHSELTLFSNIVPEKNSVVSFKSLLSITTFFCSLDLKNLDTFKAAFGFGDLAYKNKISLTDVTDQTVGVEKFKEPLITEPPFKTGDVVFSLSNTKTEGWVRLEDSITVGSFISGATYNNPDYKNLYLLMWNHPETSVQTMYGNTTDKGESALEDWDANKRLMLPSKHSLFTSQPDTTLTSDFVKVEREFNLKAGLYEVYLVGGGSNSVATSVNHDKWWNHGATGGSGAGYRAVLYLPAKTVARLSVGGLTEQSSLSFDGFSGSVVCGGATSGYAVGEDTYAGTGGVYSNTLDSRITQNVIVGKNGNNGTSVWGVHYTGTLTQNGVFDNNWGNAASTHISSRTNKTYTGFSGYGSLRYIGPFSDEEKGQKLYNFMSYVNSFVKI